MVRRPALRIEALADKSAAIQVMEVELPGVDDAKGFPGPPVGALSVPVLNELDIVRLSRDFKTDVGVVPRGTEATILQVFDGGRAYQVEFEGPYEVPETVLASYLEASVARSA